MDGTLTLQQQTSTPDLFNPDLVDDIYDVVCSASHVIAPLGPIASFAARSPWSELEDQSFEQVARWIKDIRDIDIYPSASLLQGAKNQGEIDPKFLDTGLQHWMDSQSLRLPRDVVERFCRAALHLDELPAKLLTETKLKALAKKLNHLVLPAVKSHPLQTLSFRFQQESGVKVEHDLNRHLIKWCKLFSDGPHTVWSLPYRAEGFYQAWRRLVQYDPALSRVQRQLLKNYPDDPAEALKKALSALDIPPSQAKEYLEAHLLSLPGWAGMMLWHSQQTLTEYLAVRVSMEWVLMKPYLPLPKQQPQESSFLIRLIAAWAHWGDFPIESWSQLPATEQKARLTLAHRFDDLVRRQLWLEAWEQTYEERLREKIIPKPSISHTQRPVSAQFAFCIDTRSEPFRRALEKAGPYETFGVAGFFGLPIETRELGSKRSHASLPVILNPQHRVQELASRVNFESYQQRRLAAHAVKNTFQVMKHNILTSLLLPEVSGPWLSLQMLAHSFVPRKAGRALRQLRNGWLQKPSTELSLDYVPSESELPMGFTEQQKLRYVRQALKMMDLIKDFAPLVVICGHASHTTNNAYASALHCGACGGASGGINARVLATLCNQAQVRQALAKEGIVIPEDTAFVAAEHITTVNELCWLYVPELSAVARKAFDQIQEALPGISEQVNLEQLSRLPHTGLHCKKPKNEVQRLAEDWSEVRPEWGLARNAAFIIGTRQLTKECNLDGRVFLHTYDWKDDTDGALLSNIISGPATVAEWINLQYYASTVAPHFYGSGNKATQTVTAGFGVMQGNASDLLLGLPRQSVMKSDEDFYHAPLRLLVIIQAPNDYVERLMDSDPEFCQKVQNGWIRLATIDPKGRWETWSKYERTR